MKMKRLLLKWIPRQVMPSLALMALLFLAPQCYYDSEEELYSNFPENACDTAQVSFSAQVSPIIAQNCAVSGCHAGANATAGLNLTEFQTIQSIAQNGQLVGQVTGTGGDLMPPTGSLPDCDIALIKSWVNQGAPDN